MEEAQKPQAVSEITNALASSQAPAHDCCGSFDPEGGSGRTTKRPEKAKTELATRLRRIEGQVRGIGKMIEEDVYCDDILHQISAAQAALSSVSKQLLENHMRTCLVSRIQAGENEVIDELLVTVKAMLK